MGAEEGNSVDSWQLLRLPHSQRHPWTITAQLAGRGRAKALAWMSASASARTAASRLARRSPCSRGREMRRLFTLHTHFPAPRVQPWRQWAPRRGAPSWSRAQWPPAVGSWLRMDWRCPRHAQLPRARGFDEPCISATLAVRIKTWSGLHGQLVQSIICRDMLQVFAQRRRGQAGMARPLGLLSCWAVLLLGICGLIRVAHAAQVRMESSFD